MEIYMQQTVKLLLEEQPVIAKVILSNSEMVELDNGIKYLKMIENESETIIKD